ncbi:MAG: DNA mismatch repair endonuclease MutL [Lachnospiraceae bacterium]|nr:DNA mismatch repair endonuclease MutL [Lachnospiraceae bacterium]MCI9204691.1 DNA mismatch repair endonuclease MutL [Lachnospiraceae bacterium]
MSQIQVLSQSTIDKIAAGEVVERPLSVVKELTENAIDAGATAITVEIKEGGISLIRVTDNGSGIEKNQVKKAFLRHATSKITSIEDLNIVESLGFRGEALSSIAAVAQVEVITKTEKELTGVRFAIAGGVEEELEEIGAPSGTTFFVRNLFFNTPVRRKFLKQPQTEGGYVADLLERLALSHPEISVKFIQNNQLKFHTSGNGNLKEIIYRIYGRDMADAVLPFEMEGNGFSVKGFLGKPEINRSNRNFETCFVNGRYVRNDIITKAMEEGYKACLMQHKFPFYVLHFTMEPGTVDVNVHPAKMEIRLIHGGELYTRLSGAVHTFFRQRELIPQVSLAEKNTEAEKEKQAALSRRAPEPFETRRMTMVQDEASYGAAQPLVKEQPKPSEIQNEMQKIEGNKIIGGEISGNPLKNAGIHSNIIKASEHVVVERPEQLNLFEDKFLTPKARQEYQILGQIFDTYWLVAFQDKLFIIDQHAAHEKVKYERLVKKLEDAGNNQEVEMPSQMLNPPVVISLTGKEEELLRNYMSFFGEMGFELEEFGSGAYACRSVPMDLYGCNEKELFLEILDELAQAPLQGAPTVILHKLASMACKAAVKGNHKLTRHEMEALIDELLTLDNPYHCPHGRPTIISMSKYEIEKKFKRIV